MAELFYDVVIVGGGPAGSACGLFLKKQAPDLRVCLVDKQQFPRNKPCGDGLSPGVVDLLREAGLHTVFSDKPPISVFELSHNGAIRIKYDLRNLSHTRAYGYVYDRRTFDHHLLQGAAAAGVAVFEKHEITAIQEGAQTGTTVTCRYTGGTTHITGTIVVGADGAYSRVRSYLNLPPNPEAHSGISLRYYCTTTAVAEMSLRIDVLKNLGYSYGWFFPLSQTTANVGVGIDANVYKKGKINLNKELDAYLKFLRTGLPLEIIPGSRAGYPLPYGSRLPKLAQGNKVLIGDAASMINPLTGEGIYYALYAGKLLAQHLGAAFHSGRPLSDALLPFEHDFKKQFHQHYQLNGKLKKLLISPAAPLFLKMLQRDPTLLHNVMGIVMGNATTLDVGYLPLKILKKSTRFLYEQFKSCLPKQSAGL